MSWDCFPETSNGLMDFHQRFRWLLLPLPHYPLARRLIRSRATLLWFAHTCCPARLGTCIKNRPRKSRGHQQQNSKIGATCQGVGIKPLKVTIGARHKHRNVSVGLPKKSKSFQTLSQSITQGPDKNLRRPSADDACGVLATHDVPSKYRRASGERFGF